MFWGSNNSNVRAREEQPVVKIILTYLIYLIK